MKPEELLPLARKDLAVYATAVWPRFTLPRHLRVLTERLEAVATGQIRRLIVAMPPRHGKTMLTSDIFPAWWLGQFPDRQVVFATYSQEFAEEHGRRVRNLLADPRHQAIFPGCRLSEDSAAAHRFATTAGGVYAATGRGGSLTGRGADLLVLDDPLKGSEEAQSSTIRRQLHVWFRTDVFTRLHPDAAVVLVSTRWHEDDLAGMLLREHPEENWTVLSLPAIAELGDPLGRVEGEALWPERFPLKALEGMKRVLGSAAFTALYQQRPSAAEGAVFRRTWWRFYRETPASFDRIVMSADTAFQEKETADYSAVTVWGETKTGFYLLLAWRERLEFPELKRRLVALAAEWKPMALLIEDRASGQSLLQEFRRETSLPLVPVSADKSKLTRAAAVTPSIEAGRVYLPEGAAWLDVYLDELSSFPAAPHDDLVDSTTQALNYLRGSGQSGVAGFYAKRAEEARRAELEAYWRPRTTSPEALEAAVSKALADDDAREEWNRKLREEQADADREQRFRGAGLTR